MWTLKNNVKIVLKRHGLIVTKETLAKNQALANVILEDAVYNAHYGHNLVQLDTSAAQETQAREDEDVIAVNIKKKADALREQEESESATSEDTALTFDNAGTDGMVLKFKERKRRSRSNGSRRQKAASAKDASAGKNSDASAATSE